MVDTIEHPQAVVALLSPTTKATKAISAITYDAISNLLTAGVVSCTKLG